RVSKNRNVFLLVSAADAIYNSPHPGKKRWRFHMGHVNRHMTRREFLNKTAAAAAVSAIGAALPFRAEAETALKPIWLNQYTYNAPDMKKTVDWYMEVFGMQKGNANAKETHLWFGDLQGDTLLIVRQAQAGDTAPGLTKFGFTINYWDKNYVQA